MRFCLLFSLLVFACNPSKHTTIDPPKNTGNCQQITNKPDFRDIRKDPYQLLSTNLVGDCLELKVTYSGGCEGARFELFYKQATDLREPSVHVLLGFTDEDHCRSIVEKSLLFDLTPIQHKNQNKVQLILDGQAEPILYTY